MLGVGGEDFPDLLIGDEFMLHVGLVVFLFELLVAVEGVG